jgi:hypothetical protein
VQDASAALESFSLASELDGQGREAEAIPHYRAALQMGLSGDNRQRALLGLGSSLRNVGNFTESVDVLRAATEEFPESSPLRAFLALSLCSVGRGNEAAAVLLQLVIEQVPLDGYEGPLAAYQSEIVDGGPR